MVKTSSLQINGKKRRGSGIKGRQMLRIIITLFIGPAILVFPGLLNAPDRAAADLPLFTKVQIAAVGDIMVHSPQLRAQYNPKTNRYDFTNNFRFVKPYILHADIALANLETTFGGDAVEYSGYPRFNTPDSLADALKDVGFDIIVTAHNHTVDTGIAGMFRTIDVLQERELQVIGTKKSQEESFIVKEIKGIKIGFSAFTYETPRVLGKKTINYIIVPPEYEDLIDSFSYQNLEEEMLKVKERIKVMRDEGAEFIVLYLHWGDEYQRQPNAAQRKIAGLLADYGVNLILGSHPHVLQPIEFIRSKNGNHVTLVVFSLGNFISNQRAEFSTTTYTEDGVIVYVEIKKDLQTGDVFPDKISYVPTWVHKYMEKNRLVFEILPLDDVLVNPEDYNLSSEANIRRAANSKNNTADLFRNSPAGTYGR